MGNYFEIANGPGMWLACAPIFAVATYQATRITYLAFKSGESIGLSRSQMLRAFRSGMTTAVVPSLAILLGLAVLIPTLGVPFPWMRLSVIGSVQYELMASGIATEAVGGATASGQLSADAFASSVWVMSLGTVFGMLFVALFTPKIGRLKAKLAGGDDNWMAVMTAAAFFGAVAYLVASSAAKGGASLAALSGGAASMVAVGALITVGRQSWLREWALPLSILGGMATAGLAHYYWNIGGLR